jgi:hypothetical protein
LLLDLGYQVIIIEVDENQHTEYDCSCENKRTMQLSQDLGHRPIVFIRFNPDDYEKDGTSVTSCWFVNGKRNMRCEKIEKDRMGRETKMFRRTGYLLGKSRKQNK